MGTNTQILSTSWDACPRQVTHFVYFDHKQTLSQQLSSREDDDGVSLFWEIIESTGQLLKDWESKQPKN